MSQKDKFSDEGKRQTEQEKPNKQNDRTRMRSIVLGTLAASGAFQLNGWQAQAHGNRSSHSVAALKSDLFLPQDYVTFRQQLTAPDTRTTTVLSQLRSKVNSDLANTSAEFMGLKKELGQLQKQLQLRETSSQVVKFLLSGEVDAAVAAIEGEGLPEKVMHEYLWTITDIAYLGLQGNMLANNHERELIAIAGPAMEYSGKLLNTLPEDGITPFEEALIIRIAEVYHNIASYLIPDIGEPSKQALKIGYQAAQQSLKTRHLIEDKQRSEIVIANWTMARYEGLTGNTKKSVSLFENSIEQARKLEDNISVAWGKYGLSQLDGGSQPKGLLAEVNDLLDGSEGEPLAELLKLEMSKVN